MPANTRRSRKVLLVMAVLMLVVAATVIMLVPRGEPDSVLSRDNATDAVVRVRIVIDSIDGARNAMKVRFAAGPTEKPLPEDGITIYTSVDAMPPIRLKPGGVPQEVVGDLSFERGDITAYPFDRYQGDLQVRAVKGTGATPSNDPADEVPAEFVMIDSSIGFEGNVQAGPVERGLDLHFELTRDGAVVTWASIMMAMYWLLTFAVMSVTIAVVLGLREWESRHLAWLGAMIFAFASFRATAPGSPPIGVYLDFAAFFWAESLVALSLLALVIYYLAGLPDRLRGEVPPEDASAAASPTSSSPS